MKTIQKREGNEDENFKGAKDCFGSQLSNSCLEKLDFSKVGVYGGYHPDFCDVAYLKIIYFGDGKDEKALHSGVNPMAKINIVQIFPYDRFSPSCRQEDLANADKILSKLDLKNIHAVILNDENRIWGWWFKST